MCSIRHKLGLSPISTVHNLLQWIHLLSTPLSFARIQEMDPVVLDIAGKVSPIKVEESESTAALQGKLSFACIGTHELFSPEVWRASVAELVGTAVLVFVLDTVVISSYNTSTDTPKLVISLFVIPTITVLLLATFPISGGHINPVITFSAALVGLISVSRAFVYILAQCAGAVLGALALKAVVGSSLEERFSLGGCTLSAVVPGPDGDITIGISTGQALCLEIICTFVFLFASVWIAFDDRQAKELGLVVVCSIIGTLAGVLVFVSTTVTANKGYAGAGMNPARCLGPAIVRGAHLWNDLWVFWVGPAIACSLFYLYVKAIRDLPPWAEVLSKNGLS